MPVSEMPGDLKMMSSVWFIVNCDICQQETRICKHSREKRLIYLFGKELFIQFTASAFRKLRSIYVFSYFPFGFEGRMWDLIVSVPDHCLSFYFICRIPAPYRSIPTALIPFSVAIRGMMMQNVVCISFK